MYTYKIGNKEVTRKEFVKFVSEECKYHIYFCCGFGVANADYKAGERETKRMQAEAYRDYQRKVAYGRNFKAGYSNVLYAGVKNGSLEVAYSK